MKRMSTLTSERRNDLHLTSTGVALARRPNAPLDLPPLSKPLHSSLPLPPLLAPSPSAPTTNDLYQTTTSTAYDKGQDDDDDNVMQSPQYRKAPGHWKVNYTLEAINKLESKPWRRALTMANQQSEMRAKFCEQPDMIDRVLPSNDPQPPSLADHLNEGPTKDLVPTNSVRHRTGREQKALTEAVLDKNQPYLTTNNRCHRTFARQEQLGYARKDAATYWLCEGYPKAWGHGTRDNPLTTPTNRSGRGPMRDRTVFRTGTSIQKLSPSVHPLSQSLRTVYNDTHMTFDEEKKRQIFYCPVKSSTHTQGYDTSLVQLVPQMYKTGNMIYGPVCYQQTVE